MLWTKAFWKGAAERAIRTMAQAFLAIIGTGAVGVLDIDWLSVASVTLMAGILSVVSSIGSPDFVAGVAPKRVER